MLGGLQHQLGIPARVIGTVHSCRRLLDFVVAHPGFSFTIGELARIVKCKQEGRPGFAQCQRGTVLCVCLDEALPDAGGKCRIEVIVVNRQRQGFLLQKHESAGQVVERGILFRASTGRLDLVLNPYRPATKIHLEQIGVVEIAVRVDEQFFPPG